MATLTAEAAIDSLMEQTDPDGSHGSLSFSQHAIVYLGEDKLTWRRAIGNFDISELAGSTIDGARLVRDLYGISSGGQNAVLSRCTRPEDWSESGVTWNSYAPGQPWTAGGGDFDDAGPPAKITYTEPTSTGPHEILGLQDFVTDALDNRDGIVSIIIRLDDEDPGVSTNYVWRAREYGTSIWRLVVDYTPPPSPNPGRRSSRRSAFGSGVASSRPARSARPASGALAARPRQSRQRD